VVTVRPPATEAHYHNPESEGLFDAVMKRAYQTADVRVVLLPRNRAQGERIRVDHPEWFKDGKTVIPGSALDGMNLIWHSDLVVSGGGTMNREAAALGVPVYSIFRGTIGAVDLHLKSEGRLVLLESLNDVQEKLKFTRKPRRSVVEVTSKRTLGYIVDTLQEIAEQTQRNRS
jgi:predicted glycosyltransferase